MLTTTAGQSAIRLIKLAFQANQPVLAIGPHGIGKSALFSQAAQELKIRSLSRDLSLMEPTDLLGLPVKNDDDGRVHYAPPAFLPICGRGLLIFEELNRAPRYMQAPCLTLLTERTVGDYVLPSGWLPCACINEGDGYQVEELDAALRSRFLQIRLAADTAEWMNWARKRRIHPKILRFLEQSPKVFEDADANPRAWTYASRLLRRWEKMDPNEDLLLPVLVGTVGETWAVAFHQFYKGELAPLMADQVLAGFRDHRRKFRGWVRKGRLDLVTASIEALKRRLANEEVCDFIHNDQTSMRNINHFLCDLPADLREEFRAWLIDHQFDVLELFLGS